MDGSLSIMGKRIPILTSSTGRRALLVGLIVGAAHLAYHRLTHDDYPGDFYWALRTAFTLLNGGDPYGFTPGPLAVPYLLPVALFGFPLVWILGIAPLVMTGSVFMGISSALLAWSMLRAGETWRLASILLSGPFWAAVMIGQWSPLIVATWFLPVLSPLLVLVKPHIALPVALVRRPPRIGYVIAATVLIASLMIDVTWPLRFLNMVGPFQIIVPVLILPFGPLLFAAIFRWRDERARLLVFMAMMPQRAPYDLVALWLVPKTAREAWALTVFSWLVVLPTQTGWIDLRWGILLLYFGALGVSFWPSRVSQVVLSQVPATEYSKSSGASQVA